MKESNSIKSGSLPLIWPETDRNGYKLFDHRFLSVVCTHYLNQVAHHKSNSSLQNSLFFVHYLNPRWRFKQPDRKTHWFWYGEIGACLWLNAHCMQTIFFTDRTLTSRLEGCLVLSETLYENLVSKLRKSGLHVTFQGQRGPWLSPLTSEHTIESISVAVAIHRFYERFWWIAQLLY